MKNKKVETNYCKAKKESKKRNSKGNKYKIYHEYLDESGNLLKQKGYWDDVGVYGGSLFTVICWTHPRYMFEEKVKENAYNKIDRNIGVDPFFKNFKKKYKNVGKSRKKVVSYEYSVDTENTTYPKISYTQLFEDELKVTDHVQRCSIVTYITKSARYVHVCYPIEVICEDSLKAMADEVIGYVRDYSKFYEKYGDYVYTIENYLNEKEC